MGFMCDVCKKAMTLAGYYTTPVDHCHHDEEKEKPRKECWCDFPKSQRWPSFVSESFGNREWEIKYCPVCTRKLNVRRED